MALVAAPAGAVVANTPGGHVSYLPLNEAAGAHNGAVVRSTVPSGKPPLLYHGGPVMHSQTSYAIFWAPAGYSFPTGYASAITSYLENVAADSGKPSNVYSVSAQYTDETGHASYSDAYGGSVSDSDGYPTGSGACPLYSGAGESFTACLTDERIEEEVLAEVAAKGWPNGLGSEYYVVLPPEVGSCFEEEEGGETEFFCFDTEEGFCAYHSITRSPTTIYANISYSPGDVEGCGVGEYPSGPSNGNVDDTLSSLSHEANESITDPTLEAWFDEKGFENGDECRNSSDDYGTPLGGLSGTLFNESIGAGHYYLQQEWSNDVNDCVQRVKLPSPAIADPGQLAVGQTTLFDAGGSAPGSGHIASYGWNFGDGDTGSGKTASHAFATTGEFTVTLTLEDDGGFTKATTRKVSVVNGHGLTVSTEGAGSGTVTGPGLSCPGTCSRIYPIGESVTLTATPAAGSAFAGWSGAGCSGTGSCEVTMSAERAVTATFTLLPPTAESPPAGGTAPAPTVARPVARSAKCRKGFKKAKRHGKTVCVKKKHRKHH
ncbi:MAG TPA: PKD domain-containing protein [Solirubrobacterales bacterium]